MPKDTFFNLPEEKRALICRVAIDEFAEHSFDLASINRIVARAGIAKGSFYQYFEDKQDLFRYLLQLAAEQKTAYLSPVMDHPEEHDLFILLRELYLSGIQFAVEHPDQAAIGKRLLENKEAPMYDEIMADYWPTTVRYFERILENAVRKGEIRADLDVKMFAYMIASMNRHVVEYYLGNVAQDDFNNMMATIDRFLDFLRFGLTGCPQGNIQHARLAE
jgi:AcrR family transcriptional regulator